MSDPNQPPYPQQPQYPDQPQPPHDPFAQTWGTPQPMGYYAAPVGPQRPTSTIVLGIIGLLYAFYLTVCVCGGLAMMTAGNTFSEAAMQGMTPEQRAQFEQDMELDAWDVGGGIVAIGVGILAWVGSIGSFMGRELGRKSLIWFAWAFLGMMVLNLVVEAVRGFPELEQAKAQFAQQGSGAPPMGIILTIVGACMLVFLIYPICVLYFYTRDNVKQWFRQNSAAAVAGQPQNPGMYYQQ
jgi:hypothetical protein